MSTRRRRSPSLAVLGAVGLVATLSGCGAERLPDERPSLVIVLSDALRAASLPAYGYQRDTTPFLDQLAGESIVFDHHLANYPGTPISVSQMFSGRFVPPLLMGFGYAIAPVRALDDQLLVLPQALQERGYHTALVSAHPWFDDTARILDAFDQVDVLEPGAGEAYAPFERLLPAAERFLEARARDGEPFVLYVHAMDTHRPFRLHPGLEPLPAPAGWPPVLAAYDEEIRYTDRSVERLVTSLREHGLLDRSVLVFTSDHGEEHNEVGPGWWNREHGATLRRAQLHIPLLLRLPRAEHAGLRWQGLTRHLDLAPTLLRLLAADADLGRYRLDGRDLSDAIRAGDASAGADLSPAFSWRYWGLSGLDRGLIWDQWTGQLSFFDIVTAPFNYPLTRQLEPPPNAEEMGHDLLALRQRHFDAFLGAAPETRYVGRTVIGVPTLTLDPELEPPTFEQSADGHWHHAVGRLLECQPDETCPPIELGLPWAPGRYRIWVRLLPDSGPRGYDNRFTIRIGDDEPTAVAVEPQQGRLAPVELGEHEIGRLLRVRIEQPEGGVAITGFRLELVGAIDAAPIDPALEERLRALGYVQ